MLSALSHGGIPVMLVVGTIVIIRYLPTGIVQILAVLTHDDGRRLACLEVLRLRRRDAASIPSYLVNEPQADQAKGNQRGVNGKSAGGASGARERRSAGVVSRGS